MTGRRPGVARRGGRRRPLAALLVVVLAVLVSGCSGTPEPQEPGPGDAPGEVTVGPDGVQSITLVSSDDYRFVPAMFSVLPGQVRVTLDNLAVQLTHSLAFPPGRSPSDIAESIPVVAPSESDTIEFSISTPGEYAFICSFHEALGHTGVMTVAG
ncbi:MAG: plastocyanin/azurin family copper-binding protein [Actinomycetota bacterium]|nr:plastocyanin/azurin family copper-binding protein [Actinomycetota bacterium]